VSPASECSHVIRRSGISRGARRQHRRAGRPSLRRHLDVVRGGPRRNRHESSMVRSALARNEDRLSRVSQFDTRYGTTCSTLASAFRVTRPISSAGPCRIAATRVRRSIIKAMPDHRRGGPAASECRKHRPPLSAWCSAQLTRTRNVPSWLARSVPRCRGTSKRSCAPS
jgi:hypothetical protein